jgi:hypothetical protein
MVVGYLHVAGSCVWVDGVFVIVAIHRVINDDVGLAVGVERVPVVVE